MKVAKEEDIAPPNLQAIWLLGRRAFVRRGCTACVVFCLESFLGSTCVYVLIFEEDPSGAIGLCCCASGDRVRPKGGDHAAEINFN